MLFFKSDPTFLHLVMHQDLHSVQRQLSVECQGLMDIPKYFYSSIKSKLSGIYNYFTPTDYNQESRSFFNNMHTWFNEKTASSIRGVRNIGISIRDKVKSILNGIFSVVSLIKDIPEKIYQGFQKIKSIILSCADFIVNIFSRVGTAIRSVEFLVCAVVCIVALLILASFPSIASSFFGTVITIIISCTMLYAARTPLQAAFSHAFIGIFNAYFAPTTANQNFTPQSEVYPQASDFTTDLSRVIKGGLHCAAFLVCSSAGMAIPSDGKKLDDFLKRTVLVGRSFQVWESFIDNFAAFLDDAIITVAKHVFGREIMSARRIEEVDILTAEIMELFSYTNQLKIGRDHEVSSRVEYLYRKLLVIRTKYADNRKVMTALEPFSAAINNLYARCCNKNPLAHVMRMEPVCIVFKGKPGVGKSYLMGPLQQDLAKICGRFQEGSPIESQIYCRCAEQEYWDGYCGQPIVIFDDFGQRKDSVANPNLEFSELIRAVNIFPYPLHSAALHEKSNNPFNAEFVVLTTNMEVPKAISIISNQALIRRMHIAVDVVALGDVCTKGVVDPTKLAKYRSDINVDESDTSHWVFYIDGKQYTYNDLLQIIGEQYKKHYESLLQRQRIARTTAPRDLPPNVYRRPRADQEPIQPEAQPNVTPPPENTPPPSAPPTSSETPHEMPNNSDTLSEHNIDTGKNDVETESVQSEPHSAFDALHEKFRNLNSTFTYHKSEFEKPHPDCEIVYIDGEAYDYHRFPKDKTPYLFTEQAPFRTISNSSYCGQYRLSTRNIYVLMEYCEGCSFCVVDPQSEQFFDAQTMPQATNAVPRIFFQDWIRCPFATRRSLLQYGCPVGFNNDYRVIDDTFPVNSSHDEIIRYCQGIYDDVASRWIGNDFYILDRKELFKNMRDEQSAWDHFRPYFQERAGRPPPPPEQQNPDTEETHEPSFSERASHFFFRFQTRTGPAPDEPPFEEGPHGQAQSFIYRAWINVRDTLMNATLTNICYYLFLSVVGFTICAGFYDMYKWWGITWRPANYWKAIYHKFPERRAEIFNHWEHAKFHEQFSNSPCPHCKRFSTTDLLNQIATIDDVTKTHEEFSDVFVQRRTEEDLKKYFDFESHWRRDRMKQNTRANKEALDLEAELLEAESGRAMGGERRKKKFKPEGVVSQQADELSQSLRKNMAAIWMKIEDETHFVGTVLFIKGQKFLMNKHFVSSVLVKIREAIEKLQKFSFVVGNHEIEDGVNFSFEEVLKTRQEVKHAGEPTEFFMMTFPSVVALRKNILDHFVTQKEVEKLGRGTRMLMPTYERVNGTFVPVLRDGFFEHITEITLNLTKADGTTQQVVYPNSGSVTISSKAGDCGSPLIIGSDVFNKKLAGVHYGGSCGRGTFSIFSREDLEPLLRKEKCEEDDDFKFEPQGFPLKGNVRFIGTTDKKVFQSLKTKKVPSPIFNEILETTVDVSAKAPPLTPNGPMLKGLAKTLGPNHSCDEFATRVAIENYKQKILELPVYNEQDKKLLTFEQGCAGIAGDQAYPPLKRTKSAGWPYCARATKGKQKWLGTNEWNFASEHLPELKEDVNHIIENAKKGIVSTVVFVDTLKDETRTLEKVMAGKTRTFCAAPLPFSIAFRQYFSGFLAHMYRNCIVSECAVGIDASSLSWKELADYLGNVSNRKQFIAGDFSNFDGTIQHDLFMGVLEIINCWYNDSKENQLVRSILWENIHHSKHLLDKFIYQVSHGQPSGNPATAVTNSMYNSLAVRYCHFRITGNINFDADCRMIAYGDDNVLSILANFGLLTPKNFEKAFAEIGMVYTNEDKGEMTDELRCLHEISFLKRGFTTCEYTGRLLAPLNLTSILETTNWITTTMPARTALLENCKDACEELAMHDKTTYDHYTNKIRMALINIGLDISVLEHRFARQLLHSNLLNAWRPLDRPFV